jgi:hypothetical protein
MKAPETQAEHIRQLHTANTRSLPKIRKPNGQKLNYLEIRQEHQRRLAERLQFGHPHEKSRQSKAQRTPIARSYQPADKQESAYLKDHPRSGKALVTPKQPKTVAVPKPPPRTPAVRKIRTVPVRAHRRRVG